jgi:hypothetical protein
VVTLAVKTLEAIDAAIEADGGNLFRKHLKASISGDSDAFDDEADEARSHLGASIIGKECSRAIWYGFRWFAFKKHSGRMLRLFNRGHLEEPRFIAMLKMIGAKVWSHDENGNQLRVKDHRGHFGGSLDAVVLGIPDAPGIPVLAEFKTHGDASFKKLASDGVARSKLAHFVQMQMYMGYQGLQVALYLAVNKNTDELYGEIVLFDSGTFERFRSRAAQLVDLAVPPQRIKDDPTWYVCKFCDYHRVCHRGDKPLATCRSCKHVLPKEDGRWLCQHYGNYLEKEDQLLGCDSHDPIL